MKKLHKFLDDNWPVIAFYGIVALLAYIMIIIR